MELAKIEVVVHGPIAEHNMPCAVCREEHAVLDLSCGAMRPCWECENEGWRLIKTLPGSPAHWLAKKVFGELE